MSDVPELRQLQNDALRWLVSVHDAVACGWGWLAHIPPNEQNSAEVVVALIQHAEDLDQHRQLIVRCVERQLIASQAVVTKDWIWVAYALLTVKAARVYPDEAALDEAIDNALREVDALWDAREGGWPDSYGESCQVTWTALALILLRDYLTPTKVSRATRFLARAQNGDGGWGLWNISEDDVERLFQSHPRLIARASSQVASNAGCTALATLALSVTHEASGPVSTGVKWLLAHALDSGGWPVFQQIGLRRGETFTYRHFSTTWTIRALLAVDKNYIYDETVIAAVMYLINLQDIATNGWRSAEDADPFTWATCNALDAVAEISDCLLIKTPNMFRVISQWHQTRHLRGVATVQILRTRFVFNESTSLAGSLLITILVGCSIALLAGTPKPFQLISVAMLCLIAGIPWVFQLKGPQQREWGESLIIVLTVVGLIIGVLLAVGSVASVLQWPVNRWYSRVVQVAPSVRCTRFMRPTLVF
jgi:Squalene-hopene cyclase C-terminal domain